MSEMFVTEGNASNAASEEAQTIHSGDRNSVSNHAVQDPTDDRDCRNRASVYSVTKFEDRPPCHHHPTGILMYQHHRK